MYWKNRTPKGDKLSDFFSNLDVLPTIAEWTRSPLPPGIDGEPVGFLLSKTKLSNNHKPVYYLNSSVPEVVRDNNWKLRRTTVDGKELIELYNLSWDPSERTNLSEKYPEK